MPLDWWEEQNIAMDAAAKRYGRRHRDEPSPAISFPHEGWHFWLGDSKVSSFSKEEIYEYVQEQTMKDYWQRNCDLAEHWEAIDWLANKKALKGQPWGTRRWFLKHATRHCATGRQMLRRGEWSHDKCPRCGAANETTTHVLRCTHLGAQSTWRVGLHKLRDWMQDYNTSPTISSYILAHLRAWVSYSAYTGRPPGRRTIRKAIQSQTTIGWYNFLLGRLSKELVAAQHNHYLIIGSKKTGLRWATVLIRKLHTLVWDMWQHRNKIKDEQPELHFQSAELQVANQRIDEELATGNRGLLPADKYLFSHTTELKSQPLADKELWLRAVELAREAAIVARESRRRNMNPNTLQAQRQSLRRWMSTA